MEESSTDSDQLEEDTQLALALSISTQSLPPNNEDNKDFGYRLESYQYTPSNLRNSPSKSSANLSKIATHKIEAPTNKLINEDSLKHGKDSTMTLRRSARLSQLNNSRKKSDSATEETIKEFFEEDFENESLSKSSSDESENLGLTRKHFKKNEKKFKVSERVRTADSAYKRNLEKERSNKRLETLRYIWKALRDPAPNLQEHNGVLTFERLKYCLESCNMDVEDKDTKRMIAFCNLDGKTEIDYKTFNDIFEVIGIKTDENGRII